MAEILEATSRLTLRDLMREAAVKMGIAYYGEDGRSPADIPIEFQDYEEVRRIVNTGIRLFASTAPPTGWRWMRPTISVVIWPDIAVDPTVTVSSEYDPITGFTTITASAAVFHPSMEQKDMVVTDFGTVRIGRYVSATQVRSLNSQLFSNKTFSIASDGNFTLSRNFVGSYTGTLSYAAGTNRATHLEWTNEAQIRRYRSDVTVDTGWPGLVAIRKMAVDTQNRFELMTYPRPHEELTLLFPADIWFDDLEDLNDLPPTPIIHDETIKAAVFAVIERDVSDIPNGPLMDEFLNRCIPQSHMADARMAPRKLGYFGNPTSNVNMRNFRDYIQRPNVEFR